MIYTAEQQAEIEAANNAVAEALAKRRNVMDRLMLETARVRVGDDLYNLETGQLVGRVSKLQRYWRDRDDGVRDTSPSHTLEYEMRGMTNCFDNTTRQHFVRFGTKEMMIEEMERRLSAAKRTA